MLVGAMLTVGMATQTLKPEKKWTFEEGPVILNEGDPGKYIEFKRAMLTTTFIGCPPLITSFGSETLARVSCERTFLYS